MSDAPSDVATDAPERDASEGAHNGRRLEPGAQHDEDRPTPPDDPERDGAPPPDQTLGDDVPKIG